MAEPMALPLSTRRICRITSSPMAAQCSWLNPGLCPFGEGSPVGRAIPDSGLASRAAQTDWQADARTRPAAALNSRGEMS
jgi:hypothetical protein